MAVVDNIIDGSDLVETQDAIEKTMICIVTGVSGGNDAEREYDAISAVGVPAIGAALGSTAPLTNVRVVERRASPASSGSNEIYRVTVQYSSRMFASADPSDATLPRYNSTTVLQLEETNQDINGSAITVSHNYGGDIGTKTTGAFVSVYKPAITEVMTRIEEGIEPLELSKAYAGKTNSETWLLGAVGTWLCTRIDATYLGRNVSDELVWDVNYEFSYRADGWKPKAVFIDDQTGQPVNGIVEDVGIVEVDSYGTADFNELQLV